MIKIYIENINYGYYFLVKTKNSTSVACRPGPNDLENSNRLWIGHRWTYVVVLLIKRIF